jgi:uncharacterized protein (DUF302 family)
MRGNNAFAVVLGQAVREAVLSACKPDNRIGSLRGARRVTSPGVQEVEMDYYMQKTMSLTFQKALERVKEELGKQGFGVLTEIDVRETLKTKLDVDFRNYRILGACNPPFAYQLLQMEERIGLLLPCNIIVQEAVDGRVEAAAIDPTVSLKTAGNPRLMEVAEQVRTRLRNVIAAL